MERKVAIVTGSATGVGAATAVLLAEKGCNVIINYTKSKKEAEETAEIIRKKGAEVVEIREDALRQHILSNEGERVCSERFLASCL